MVGLKSDLGWSDDGAEIVWVGLEPDDAGVPAPGGGLKPDLRVRNPIFGR
jgi:hypothetical protein